MEDACPDTATVVACVDDAPRRCLLLSLPLPSCTPRGPTVISLRDFLGFVGNFALFWSVGGGGGDYEVGFSGGRVVILCMIEFCIL